MAKKQKTTPRPKPKGGALDFPFGALAPKKKGSAKGRRKGNPFGS
jgi:hypothetical protein